MKSRISRSNAELTRLFWEMSMAAAYLGEGEFVARAYRNAYEIVKKFPEDISGFVAREGKAGLLSVNGIGQAIASKIMEFMETGEISAHREMLSKLPPGAMQLMRVKGIGPATARRLSLEMGIDDLDQLKKAINDGTLARFKGFGPKKIESIKEQLGL